MPNSSQTIQRKIIHIDMDCFFAAVEVRENPALKGRPVAVGGLPGQRGVVAACNYEAREFGVHSAMPMSIAFRQCPELVRLPVRMDLYKQVSVQIRAIFQEYTDLIEPLSLDEAYLDVSASKHCKGSASLMAMEIRQRIFETTGLTASAGIAPNKLIAKIASDWNKPNGQTLITPDKIDTFMAPLAVKKIYGVGKVTAQKMHALGIETCLDLQALSMVELQQHFKSFGARLYEQCRGIDTRAVNNDRTTKSLSIEDTYAQDLADLSACQAELEILFQGLLKRFERAKQKEQSKAEMLGREAQAMQPKTLVLKMRFSDFMTTTAQSAGTAPDLAVYQQLCERTYARGERPVRLLGLGLVFDMQAEAAAKATTRVGETLEIYGL
ncbi:MAG: DNA polymerase IV [Arenicellales bacterium]